MYFLICVYVCIMYTYTYISILYIQNNTHHIYNALSSYSPYYISRSLPALADSFPFSTYFLFYCHLHLF